MADGEVDVPSIVEEVKGMLSQDLQVVSYKWLARQYQINANLAKRLLVTIAETLKGQVAATYLVSGWTKDAKQHVIKVVQGVQIQDACAQLDPITCKHIYSLCPGTTKDPAVLAQQDYLQSVELMRDALKGNANASLPCFKANTCSAITFTPPPKTEPRLKRAPMRVEEEPQAPQRSSGAVPASRAAKDSSAGKSSFFSPSSGKASGTAADTAAPAELEAAKATEDKAGMMKVCTATAEPPPSAAAAGPKPSPTKHAATGARARAGASLGKGGMSLAQAWSKKAPAPTKKEPQAEPDRKEAEQKLEGSKQAALEEQQQEQQRQEVLGEEDEEDWGPKVQRGKNKRAVMRLEDSDEEEQQQEAAQPPAKKQQQEAAPPPAQPPQQQAGALGPEGGAVDPAAKLEGGAAKAASKAGAQTQAGAGKPSSAKRGRQHAEDEDAEAGCTAEPHSGRGSSKAAAQKPKEAPPKAAKGPASKVAKETASVKQKQSAKEGAKEQQQGGQANEAPVQGPGGRADAPGAGAGEAQPQQEQQQGPRMKRQKVMQSYINDKGEEVTEEVMVDVQMTEAEVAAEAAKSSSCAKAGGSGTAGAGPSSGKGAASGGGGDGGGKAGAGTKAGGSGKASGVAAPKGKGKAAAPANQKNIMSFFNKK